MITSNDQYNSLRQPIRKIHMKLDIINKEEVVIDSFDGIAVDGSITMSADNTYRRSGTLSMILDKKHNIIPAPDSKIWYDKRCGIHIGVEKILGGIEWFNLGRFAMSQVDIDIPNKTLTCQLKDYMSFLDGTLGGTLTHKILIEGNTVTVRDAIQSVVKELPRTSVENIEIVDENLSTLLPYDLEREPDSTIYSVLEELIGLYMDYEMYFDEFGYFTVARIQKRYDDPVMEVFDGGSQDLTITPSFSIDFEEVKNSVYVWGYCDGETGEQTSFIYRNRFVVKSFDDISSIKDFQVGDIVTTLDTEKAYVLEEIVEVEEGVDTPKWTELDFRVYPTFSMDKIDEKPLVIIDDNIWNEEQAKLRAEYELIMSGSIKEKASLEIVPLYNLNINDKIVIKGANEKKEEYLIKDITIPLNIESPMTVQAERTF